MDTVEMLGGPEEIINMHGRFHRHHGLLSKKYGIKVIKEI